MKLHDSTCRSAKPAAKNYKLADGAGLYLLVKTNGKKYWRMKYTYLGNEKTLAIGVYPLVSLMEARAQRDTAKKLLAKGADPTADKQQSKQKAIRNAQNTFKVTALEWHETKRSGWSASYARDVLHKLETDIFPLIGDQPLATITPPVLLHALKKIEERGAWDKRSFFLYSGLHASQRLVTIQNNSRN